MTKLLVLAHSLMALSLVAGCKKKAPSCDDIFDHTVSLMPTEMQGSVKANREGALAKCEKMSPEAKQCAADAKSLEDLAKCSMGDAATKGPRGGDRMKAPASDGPAEFAAWDMTARQAAWQGAWSGDGGGIGVKAAWEIAGDAITFVDSKGEKKLSLEVTSPCTAKFVEKGSDGSSSSTTSVYTLQDGQLVTGLGDAGQKKGDQAVVCGGGKIFTFDGKACLQWEDNFGRMKSSPGECGFAKDGDKEVFRYKAYGSETTLLVEGDVIWSEQLKRTHAAKQPDLATARKAQGL